MVSDEGLKVINGFSQSIINIFFNHDSISIAYFLPFYFYCNYHFCSIFSVWNLLTQIVQTELLLNFKDIVDSTSSEAYWGYCG